MIPNFLKPLDLDALRDEINAKINENVDYNPLPADAVQYAINATLLTLSNQWDKLNYIIAQNYLEYSSGEYLDELVKLLGLKRFEGETPKATAKIIAKDALLLPKNTKFYSNDGAMAFLSEQILLEKGENVITLLGDKVGAYATTTLEVPHALIESVEMLSEFEVKSLKESDEKLRERFKGSLYRFSTAGSAKSYEFFCLVDEVAKVKATSPSAGEVDILYSSVSDKEAAIREALAECVPITDKINIYRAEPVALNISVNLTLRSTADVVLIKKAIEKNIADLINSLDLEQGVAPAKLLACAFVSEDVRDASMSELPALESRQFYTLDSIDFQVESFV